MILIFHKDGTAKVEITNEYIQQGSDKVNEILCYVFGYDRDITSYTMRITLPDNTYLNYTGVNTEFEFEDNFYSGAKFVLDKPATQVVGNLTFNLVIKNKNTSQQLVSYTFTGKVNAGLVSWDSLITNAEYNNLLAQFLGLTSYNAITPNLIHIANKEYDSILADRPYIEYDTTNQIYHIYKGTGESKEQIDSKYILNSVFFVSYGEHEYSFYKKVNNGIELYEYNPFEYFTAGSLELTNAELSALKNKRITIVNDTRLFVKFDSNTIMTTIPATSDNSAYVMLYQWNNTTNKWNKIIQTITYDTCETIIKNWLDNNKGQPNGVAGLDANGKLLSSQLPTSMEDFVALYDMTTRTTLPESVSNGKYVAIRESVGVDEYKYKLYVGENNEWSLFGYMTNTILFLYDNETWRAKVDSEGKTEEDILESVFEQMSFADEIEQIESELDVLQKHDFYSLTNLVYQLGNLTIYTSLNEDFSTIEHKYFVYKDELNKYSIYYVNNILGSVITEFVVDLGYDLPLFRYDNCLYKLDKINTKYVLISRQKNMVFTNDTILTENLVKTLVEQNYSITYNNNVFYYFSKDETNKNYIYRCNTAFIYICYESPFNWTYTPFIIEIAETAEDFITQSQYNTLKNYNNALIKRGDYLFHYGKIKDETVEILGSVATISCLYYYNQELNGTIKVTPNIVSGTAETSFSKIERQPKLYRHLIDFKGSDNKIYNLQFISSKAEAYTEDEFKLILQDYITMVVCCKEPTTSGGYATFVRGIMFENNNLYVYHTNNQTTLVTDTVIEL